MKAREVDPEQRHAVVNIELDHGVGADPASVAQNLCEIGNPKCGNVDDIVGSQAGRPDVSSHGRSTGESGSRRG